MMLVQAYINFILLIFMELL